MKCPSCGSEAAIKRQEAFEHYIMRMYLCPNCGAYAFDDEDLMEAPK